MNLCVVMTDLEHFSSVDARAWNREKTKTPAPSLCPSSYHYSLSRVKVLAVSELRSVRIWVDPDGFEERTLATTVE